MSIKTGATVRIVQPEIRGQVVRREIADDDQVRALVRYVDPADGSQHERWFAEAQIEEVQP